MGNRVVLHPDHFLRIYEWVLQVSFIRLFWSDRTYFGMDGAVVTGKHPWQNAAI
jgi:hypothetical protein